MIIVIKRVIGLTLFVITMLCLMTWIATPSEQKPVDMRVSAIGACEVAAKRAANDPDSLEFFHSRESTVIKRKDGIFVVKMPLRGHNSFNATILSHVVCYLRPEGDDWHILEIR